jgi:HicB family
MAKVDMQMIHVRIPKDLHRKLQREADKAGLTYNAQLINRLRQAYEGAPVAVTDALSKNEETKELIDRWSREFASRYIRLAEEARTQSNQSDPGDSDDGQHQATRRE